MNYAIIQPDYVLKDFISHFWTAAWNESVQHASSTYFATASSFTEIAFAFRGSKRYPELLFSSVQGPTSRYGQYSAGGFFDLFGVSLYSHATPYFFDFPASELNNQFISPKVLLGNQANQLTERIALATTTHERIKILTNYFKSRLTKQIFDDKLIIKAIKLIRQSKGNVNISALSNEFCLSQKQFERRFKAYSGFNPKLYARIVRFESVLNGHKNHANLTHAGYAYGYYDQAHFIRDFREFSGFSPTKFFDLSGY